MKKHLLIILQVLILSSLFAVEFLKEAVPSSKSSVLYVTPYDWGGCVDKIVINIARDTLPFEVKVEDFTVSMILTSSKIVNREAGLIRSVRIVEEAFLSDSYGNRIEKGESVYITLKLKVSPDDEYSSPFTGFGVKLLNADELYSYKIENEKINVNITQRTAVVCKQASGFSTDVFTYKDSENSISMNTAFYKPQNNEPHKIPLIVFFHGMGEAGKDVTKPLLSIKSTALAGEKIQSYFEDGAAVLLPQCPTGWMEVTELDPFGNRLWVMVDINAPAKKLNKKINSIVSSIFSVPQYDRVVTPVSFYTLAVKKLIDETLEKNPEIDRDRIYIGGCSAGGFMTVNMMIQYPEFFAAGFPVCEAFPDERISGKDIEKLAKKPMWFTVAQNDTTVLPEKNTFATVERIGRAGGRKLHKTYFANVKDTSGKFLNPEQTGPYEYEGHWSWIYLFNDEVFEGDLNLFEWLASQANSK